MSSLRNKLERERAESLENKGRAPRVVMPERTTDTGRNLAAARLAAEDAAIQAPRGHDLRSRLGQPRYTAPQHEEFSDAWRLRGVDLEAMDRRHDEELAAHRRKQAAIEATRQAERDRVAQVKAAEIEQLHQAGETFERETAALAIEAATGRLTLTEYDAVERIVQTRYSAGVNDPNVWRLAATEYRDVARVRALWARTPLNVLEDDDAKLARLFGTSVDVIKKLRT